MEDFAVVLTPQMLAIVPIVAAVIQILKPMKSMKAVKKYLPFIAIGLAYALCYAMKIENAVLPAIVMGMTAAGAYDTAKATVVK